MIYVYSGLVGTGKTFNAVRGFAQNPHVPVITNINCNLPNVAHFETEEITPQLLMSFSADWWAKHPFREDGIIFCLDECAIFFNSRSWNDRNRFDWISFMSTSRHYGIKIILIAQNLEMIDKQARMLCNYDVRHTSAGNLNIFARILHILGIRLTCAKAYYLDTETIIYRNFVPITKRFYRWYDTNQDLVHADFQHIDTSAVFDQLSIAEQAPRRAKDARISALFARLGGYLRDKVVRYANH